MRSSEYGGCNGDRRTRGDEEAESTGDGSGQRGSREAEAEEEDLARQVAMGRASPRGTLAPIAQPPGRARSGVRRGGEHRVEQLVEPRGREADGGVRCAVVQANSIACWLVDQAAGEDDVGDIAGALVRCDRSEHPVGEPSQDAGRFVEVE